MQLLLNAQAYWGLSIGASRSLRRHELKKTQSKHDVGEEATCDVGRMWWGVNLLTMLQQITSLRCVWMWWRCSSKSFYEAQWLAAFVCQSKDIEKDKKNITWTLWQKWFSFVSLHAMRWTRRELNRQLSAECVVVVRSDVSCRKTPREHISVLANTLSILL